MDFKNIEPSRFYSIRQLSQMNILPWRSAMTIAKVLREEKWREIFQPMVDQKKNAVRMHIKGERILLFIESARQGNFSQ